MLNTISDGSVGCDFEYRHGYKRITLSSLLFLPNVSVGANEINFSEMSVDVCHPRIALKGWHCKFLQKSTMLSTIHEAHILAIISKGMITRRDLWKRFLGTSKDRGSKVVIKTVQTCSAHPPEYTMAESGDPKVQIL